MSRIWPNWQSSRRRASRQHEEKNQARVEFSEAVVQLGRRSNTVNLIAEDAIKSMHRGDSK